MERHAQPEWFPLKVHLKQPESLSHWSRAIMHRLAIMHASQNSAWKYERYVRVVIKGDDPQWGDTDPLRDFRSIRQVTPYDAFKLAQLFDMPENAESKRLASISDDDDWSDENEKINCRQHQGPPPKDWVSTFGYEIPVFVDFSMDNESLKSHFDMFISTIRSAIEARGWKGMEAPMPINRETLRKWHELRLLAAYDLMSWRQITGIHYSDAAIARWLWPDSGPLSDGSDVDRAERFRKVTKPLLARVLNWQTVVRIEKIRAQELFEQQGSRAE